MFVIVLHFSPEFACTSKICINLWNKYSLVQNGDGLIIGFVDVRLVTLQSW